MNTFRALIVLVGVLFLSFVSTSVHAQCVNGLNTATDISQSDDSTFCSVTTSDICVTALPSLGRTSLLLLAGLLLCAGALTFRRRRALGIWLWVLSTAAAGGSIWQPTLPDAIAHVKNTGLGNPITHFHRPTVGERNFTAAEVTCINTHFDTAFPGATRTGGATITFDCHGLTFDANASWINNDQVAQILADDYALVGGVKMVGDVIVYKDGGGNIIHTGKVTMVAAGVATEIESKWGSAGTYKHAPGTSPYGGNITYYR
jgi:hypothetical protein